MSFLGSTGTTATPNGCQDSPLAINTTSSTSCSWFRNCGREIHLQKQNVKTIAGMDLHSTVTYIRHTRPVLLVLRNTMSPRTGNSPILNETPKTTGKTGKTKKVSCNNNGSSRPPKKASQCYGRPIPSVAETMMYNHYPRGKKKSRSLATTADFIRKTNPQHSTSTKHSCHILLQCTAKSLRELHHAPLSRQTLLIHTGKGWPLPPRSSPTHQDQPIIPVPPIRCLYRR